MPKRKQAVSSTNHIPKVRLAKPNGRPYQLRYECPIELREIRLSTGTYDAGEADEQKRRLEAKLLLGLEIGSRRAVRVGPEMAWADFREQYRVLQLALLRDKSAADAESRLDIAERILKPKVLKHVADADALHRLQAQILAGAESRETRKRSAHTVKGYMAAVLAALRWGHLQGWIEIVPVIQKMRVAKQKSMKGRPITAEEFDAMIKATPEVVGEAAAASWTYLLRGLWQSALRLNELMHVSWDLPGTIVPTWKDGKLPVLEIPAAMQKNDTHDTIPLLPWFESVLLETPSANRHGWVFEPQSLQLQYERKVQFERPLAEWVGKVISKIGKKAEVIVEAADAKAKKPAKYASAHDLRRSCGERLREAGVPPLVICRVMRHASWETTRRHYAPGDIQQDAKVLRDSLNITAS